MSQVGNGDGDPCAHSLACRGESAKVSPEASGLHGRCMGASVPNLLAPKGDREACFGMVAVLFTACHAPAPSCHLRPEGTASARGHAAAVGARVSLFQVGTRSDVWFVFQAIWRQPYKCFVRSLGVRTQGASVTGNRSKGHNSRKHFSRLQRINYRHNIPFSTCSFLSCHTVFPEQEQTCLSLSQTPALLAITPTSVSGSSVLNGPSWCLETTMLRPIISQIDTGLSRKAFPRPSLST